VVALLCTGSFDSLRSRRPILRPQHALTGLVDAVAQLLAALDPADLAGIEEVAAGDAWSVAVKERA
jgi:hypothetical protein